MLLQCAKLFFNHPFLTQLEMTMPNQEFSPVKSLERLWKRWLWIVAIMILGGAAGWLANHLRPPVYEARAVLNSSIDYPFAGRFSQVQMDQVFNSVTNIVIDEAVKARAMEETRAAGYTVDERAVDMDLIRMDVEWALSVRSADPAMASYLANRWAEISLQKYQERWTYASRVQLLYYEMKQIEQCRGPFRVYSMYENLCSRIGTLAGLDRQLQSMAEEVRAAEKEANGIIANYDFSLKEAAPVPQKPLSYNPNTFILAGALIGLLVSILIWGRPARN